MPTAPTAVLEVCSRRRYRRSGKLNDYSDEEDQEETLENTDRKTKPDTTGKSIAEATDPSKLSDI